MQMILQEPLFNKVRRQEQLGYIVICSANSAGIIITIYTPAHKYSTQYVNERIDAFFDYFSKEIQKMSEDDFNEQKNNFVKMRQMTNSINNLQTEVDRNWIEIKSHNGISAIENRQIQTIKRFSFEDFKLWIFNYTKNIKKFKRLSVQVEGNIDVETDDSETIKVN